MRVFLSVASLASYYGGPARSVSGLAKILADSGLDIGLWAADQSFPAAFKSDQIPAQLTILQGTFEQAIAQFGWPDIFHDNGLWWVHNRKIARVAHAYNIPRMVSLRGMIEPWALNHHRWKKALAWQLYQRRHLQIASCFHGTASKEADNAKKLGLSPRCFVIPNSIDITVPAYFPHQQSSSGTRVALFLGRLHPVKGLEPFIAAWAQVRPQGWTVKFAGPDENNYMEKLKTRLTNLDLLEQFEFLGSVEGVQKASLMQQADLLIQPSYSENFGMSIAEALAYGVPVLTTTGTPWSQIAEKGCGWWVPLTHENLVAAIQQETAYDVEQLQKMGANGKALIQNQFSGTHVSRCFVNAYEWMLRVA